MKALVRRLVSSPRLLLSRLGWRVARGTTCEEVWIEPPRGRRVYCHIHRPTAAGVYPGVVFVPGGISAGTDYDFAGELTADDVAAAGAVVLHYDPSGRGRTGGEEDRWGPAHQEELAHVVRHFAALPGLGAGGVGILSFSLGITIAAGALANHPLPVRYLFDWEGPSNRQNITLNGTFAPFRDYPVTNDDFWEKREAARFIGRIRCGYFRYQAQRDHMQGGYKGHALELLNLATRGQAAWTRCNDNPPNTLFEGDRADSCRWVPEKLNTSERILDYLRGVQTFVQDHR